MEETMSIDSSDVESVISHRNFDNGECIVPGTILSCDIDKSLSLQYVGKKETLLKKIGKNLIYQTTQKHNRKQSYRNKNTHSNTHGYKPLCDINLLHHLLLSQT